MPDQGVPEQVKIAHGIQHLMPNELVAIAQAVIIQHTVIIQNQRIAETAAQGQPILAQPLHIPHEAESTCATDLLDVRAAGKIERC